MVEYPALTLNPSKNEHMTQPGNPKREAPAPVCECNLLVLQGSLGVDTGIDCVKVTNLGVRGCYW